MSGAIAPYTALITSEHADKPDFLATISALLQPVADGIEAFNSYPTLFDLDQASGAQLDILGQWIGITRNVATPLSGVYFSFDTDGLGFGQGVWFGPGDPTTGLIALPDDLYLMLLKARIIANQWDGTIPGAYAAWNQLLAGYGCQILIQDNGDMTMTLAMTGIKDNPTFRALFSGGYLDLRPAGVKITEYLYPSASAPLFGFDVENDSVSGFDVGAWGIALIPTISLLFANGAALTTEAGISIATETSAIPEKTALAADGFELNTESGIAIATE